MFQITPVYVEIKTHHKNNKEEQANDFRRKISENAPAGETQ